MDYTAIEKKWNEYWEEHECHKFNPNSGKKKHYVLEMFSYPSASNLHLGHWYNYAPTDTYARGKKMQGYEVFQPMGFDAFGLPAENFAIKTGIHPKDSTLKNIATMETQLKAMGAMFDWDAELYTCSPDYYKWTQWLFLQLYNKGLAYQKLSPVNWCHSCNTVIANEQVLDGACERCGTAIERREMTQWFFKITAYAEELLSELDNLDWPEKTKAMQRNWIGKSIGGEVSFKLNADKNITVFTTRADTLMGVSYLVLAPELAIVDEITTAEFRQSVNDYKAATALSNDIDRLSTAKEKTGVFTGAYVTHPLTSKKIPVWIADYCLSTYGTGAVMGVPAHDTRDFDFATKYKLPITRVVKSASGENDDLPFCEYGISVNSDEFNNLTTADAKTKILDKLAKIDMGGAKINYRLRDWSISRQRYWGAPIPVIHCPKCGAVPVPQKDLPVELPYNVNFKPSGKSPLGECEEFINTTCPICGGKAKRDADTLDTFVCSSWYYLRYCDNKNSVNPFDTNIINQMCPVDKYVGGAEHACMHLLYSRFITKALRDMGYINFGEPFKSLVHQGLILGVDGNKMSKSKGNVVNPDKYVNEFGSDTFRMYLMFGFCFTEGGAWNDDGIKSISKFLDRIDRVVNKVKDVLAVITPTTAEEKELAYALNYCIKAVTTDLDTFSFNTAIARIMELVNAIYKFDSATCNINYLRYVVEELVKIVAPFTPHLSEEFNQILGGKDSIFNSSYPLCDETKLVKDSIELAVQINSKVRCKLTVNSSLTSKQIEQIALADSAVLTALNGATPKKIIIIPNRIINFVI